MVWQRQRISITRRLSMYDSQVLVLNEAAGALDANPENPVMNSINDTEGSFTMIITTKHLSAAQKCYRIISIINSLMASDSDLQSTI